MKARHTNVAFPLVFLFFMYFAQTVSAQTYITNVAVSDVEKHKLIPNQTVVIYHIENGKIKKVYFIQ